MVERNAKLSGYVLNDAAKSSGNEEDLHVALMEPLHKLPVWKHISTSVSSDKNQSLIQIKTCLG